MAEMHAEVFEAFRSIGAPEDKAIKAAVLLSAAFAKARGSSDPLPFTSRNRQDEFLEPSIDIEAIRRDVAGIKGELTLHRWMMSIVLAMVTAVLFRTFTH